MGPRTPELSRGARFRVFLLSPANCAGKRALLLQRDSGPDERDARAATEPSPRGEAAADEGAAALLGGPVAREAERLRSLLRGREGAPLGDVFSFVSSLYFRGKLAYARAFARPPHGLPGVHVITPCDGLVPPASALRLSDLRRYADVPVDAGEERYREPLLRDLRALAPAWAETDVILLGSIASAKYGELLLPVLGPRLQFPSDFVGRGDMSRGGLLLRCVEEGRELGYVPLLGAARRGPRPARLAARSC